MYINKDNANLHNLQFMKKKTVVGLAPALRVQHSLKHKRESRLLID